MRVRSRSAAFSRAKLGSRSRAGNPLKKRKGHRHSGPAGALLSPAVLGAARSSRSSALARQAVCRERPELEEGGLGVVLCRHCHRVVLLARPSRNPLARGACDAERAEPWPPSHLVVCWSAQDVTLLLFVAALVYTAIWRNNSFRARSDKPSTALCPCSGKGLFSASSSCTAAKLHLRTPWLLRRW